MVTFELGCTGGIRMFQANLVKDIVEGTCTKALRHERCTVALRQSVYWNMLSVLEVLERESLS